MARNLEFNEDEVIQKATEVFWKKGYTATSMRDLTDAMQINISSLYNTIGDKRQLFVRCIRHYTELRMREREQLVADFGSPFEALKTFITNAAHIITTEPNSCMCIKTAFEIQGNDIEVQKVINDYNDNTHQFLKRMVEDAQNAGEISQSDNAATIANYLDSLFTGWYNSYIMYQDRNRILEMAAYVITHLRS
jgi:TetR/AcrR family transcriptional repressor of nem operon